MKLTIIGDPHLTHSSIDKVKSIMSKVEDIGNPAVWLGDLLDTKEVIRGKCLSEWIDYFTSSKLNHYVLVGNHDLFNLETTRNSLEALKLIPNVLLIEDLTKINEGIYGIPYIHDEKSLKAKIKSIPKNSILFGHLELKDFDFGNGHICDKGMTEGSFKKFSKVISGHFHKYQKKANLVYLGTPFSHSFGESNQEKYIAILDTETLDLELIQTGLPKHITIELDCSDQDIPKMSSKEDYYRIILTGDQEHIDNFNKDSLKDYNVRFLTRPTKEANEDIIIEETASNMSQFEMWAKNVAKLSTEVVDLGKEILESVK